MAQPGDGGPGDWPAERDLHWKATLLRGRPSLEALWGKRAGPGDRVASLATGPGSSPPGQVGREKEDAASMRCASCPGVCSRGRGTRGLRPVTPSLRGPRPEVRAAPVRRGPATTGGPRLRGTFSVGTQSPHTTLPPRAQTPSPELRTAINTGSGNASPRKTGAWQDYISHRPPPGPAD